MPQKQRLSVPARMGVCVWESAIAVSFMASAFDITKPWMEFRTRSNEYYQRRECAECLSVVRSSVLSTVYMLTLYASYAYFHVMRTANEWIKPK